MEENERVALSPFKEGTLEAGASRTVPPSLGNRVVLVAQLLNRV